MSQVHKVINLKTPLKVFGLTLKQLFFTVIGVVLGFFFATKCPGDWKVGNLPAGLFAFIGSVSVGAAAGFMTELKPMCWWKNSFGYRLGLLNRIYIPKPSEAPLYPDPTIIEKQVSEEYYVESDTRETS